MASILKRGLFHMFAGASIPVAALFLSRVTLLVSLGVVTFLFLAFELFRLRNSGINRWFFSLFKPLLRQEEVSRLTGTSYLLTASFIVLLAFQRDIAVLALFFLVVGDAMAAIVGRHIGKRKLFGKTLEGDLACFISCLAVGLIFYHAGLDIRLPTILAGSVAAAVVQAIPLPINDNLTIPLLSAVVMTLMQL